MSKTKIVYDPIENWKGGRSAGYYEPDTNEIHILKGTDHALEIEIHEGVHAQRCGLFTQRLAMLLKSKRRLSFGLLIMLAAASPLITIYPFYALAAFTVSGVLCELYEEYVAITLTEKSVKEMRGLKH